MPLVIYEVFIVNLVAGIINELRSIASHRGPLAEFAKKIKHRGLTIVKFDKVKYNKYDLDASFKHSEV
jgi:hypothetical protein